jgi:hypothetical protein
MITLDDCKEMPPVEVSLAGQYTVYALCFCCGVVFSLFFMAIFS